jgi:hypothetical protein
VTAIYKVTVNEPARVPLAQALTELLGRRLRPTQAQWLVDGYEACKIAAVGTPAPRAARSVRAQRYKS